MHMMFVTIINGLLASSHLEDQIWFIGLALRNHLPTNDNLKKGGMVIASFCCMCKRDEETVSHLFFSCPFAHSV